jgi:hypothetical protein
VVPISQVGRLKLTCADLLCSRDSLESGRDLSIPTPTCATWSSKRKRASWQTDLPTSHPAVRSLDSIHARGLKASAMAVPWRLQNKARGSGRATIGRDLKGWLPIKRRSGHTERAPAPREDPRVSRRREPHYRIRKTKSGLVRGQVTSRERYRRYLQKYENVRRTSGECAVPCTAALGRVRSGTTRANTKKRNTPSGMADPANAPKEADTMSLRN